MAITAVAATYLTQGPTASGQILANGPSSDSENALSFTGTATLDGSTTNFVLNFIDGTKTLSFVPRAVALTITGGTQVAAAVPAIATSTPTNTGVTVYLSAAGTNANTLTFTGLIYR